MGFKFKVAFISFVFSFMFFFPIGVFLAIGFFKNSNNKIQPVNKFQFLIPKEYDLNVLFVDCNQYDGRNVADVFLIFKISAHDNSIGLLTIPGSLKTIFQNKIGNLKEFFEYGGINFVKKALESFLTIQIDRTIQADDESIKGIINCLGGLKISSNDDLYDDFEGLPIFDEKKVVGGELFSKFLKKDPVKAFLLLNKAFISNGSVNLSRFFAYFANMFVSNITVYDFEIRKKGFEEMIFKKNAVVVFPKLEVKNFNGRNVLTFLSKQSCLNAFKKN